MSTPRFQDQDLDHPLPAPGYYLAAVTTARWRRSAAGNRMAQVVFALDEVPPAYDRVADYFVVEGTTPRGLALSRSRLVELFTACGLPPKAGEPIQLSRLDARLVELKLDHEVWQGKTRLRVAGYRPAGTGWRDESEQVEGQGFLFPPAGLAQGGPRA